MEIKIMKNKYGKILGVLLAMACIFGMAVAGSGSEIVTNEAGIGGFVITALVLVVIAGALLPTIVTQSETLSANCTAQGQTTLATLVDLWPLLIGIGIVVSIIMFAI